MADSRGAACAVHRFCVLRGTAVSPGRPRFDAPGARSETGARPRGLRTCRESRPRARHAVVSGCSESGIHPTSPATACGRPAFWKGRRCGRCPDTGDASP